MPDNTQSQGQNSGQISPQTQYDVGPIPYHLHNGTDSPQIDISNILRFPSNPATGDITYFNGNTWVSLPIGSSGSVLTSSGTSPIYIAQTSALNYGNGVDGSATFDGSTTIAGMVPSANVYTMVRDYFFTTVAINTGITLKPNGFRIFASTSFTDTGTVTIAGGNGGTGGAGTDSTTNGATGGGSGGTVGQGYSTGTIKEPGNGIVGTVGLNGNNITPNTKNGGAGVSEVNGILPNNAAGGGASGTGGGDTSTGSSSNASTAGAGGTITQTTKAAAFAVVSTLTNALGVVGCNPTAGSGAGGGGGFSNNPGASSMAGGGGGGGSGAPGGIIWIASPSVTVNGGSTISATGGAGGNGGKGGDASGGSSFQAGGGGGGGAGGGNGGLILFITANYTNNGTVTVSAGAGGTGGVKGAGNGANVASTPGSSGNNGTNGSIVILTP